MAAADRTDGKALGAGRSGIFLGFAPWIIFDVAAGPSTWKLAAFTALIASLVLNLADMRRGSLKLLEVTGLVFFAVISVLALVLDRQDLMWLETYAQTLASAVIAVFGLITARTGHHGDWLNWVVPIALLVLAVKFTNWYPEHVRASIRDGGRVA
ncbi:hypothetical protein ACIQZO_04500 [Streptomyces sp. NPDC097617]|uniref:hypothetical protein n=1 Tax=Streptomyces sp. NPDC097617 TaxID=3366091 RepID=UPI0037FE5CA0